MLVVNRTLAILFIVIGVVMLVETAALGGGGSYVGYLGGVVFIALGLIRRRALRPPRG